MAKSKEETLINNINSIMANDPTGKKSQAYGRILIKEFQGAIELLNQALQSNPKDPHIFALRHIANMEIGNYNGAIADLNMILELKLNDPKTLDALEEAMEYLPHSEVAAPNLQVEQVSISKEG